MQYSISYLQFDKLLLGDFVGFRQRFILCSQTCMLLFKLQPPVFHLKITRCHSSFGCQPTFIIDLQEQHEWGDKNNTIIKDQQRSVQNKATKAVLYAVCLFSSTYPTVLLTSNADESQLKNIKNLAQAFIAIKLVYTVEVKRLYTVDQKRQNYNFHEYEFIVTHCWLSSRIDILFVSTISER